MRTLNFGDEKITSREIMIAIPSMMIAAGIITLPRVLAESTLTSDGWISLIVTGILASLFVWLITTLAANFPNQSFLTYSSALVTRPIAIFFTILFILEGILLTAYELNAVSFVSHQYLFEKTPVEVISLSFLLVVVYGVSGSRAGIFRLNVLFIPIIIFSVFLLVLFSVGYMEGKNVLPAFKTDMKGYAQGMMGSSLSFTGIGILFFYMAFVKDPKKVSGKAVFGMFWVVVVYIAVYLTCIAVFGQSTTEVVRFPLVELAKTVKIPGGFLERLESLLFVIWLMAYFTTTTMAFDVTVLAIESIFPKVDKIKIVLLLSPIIYFISALPQSYKDNDILGKIVSNFELGILITVVTLLWIAFKIKGRKGNGK